MLKMHKKAQFWYADFLLAVLILAGISFLFITSVSDLNSKQDDLQSLSSDSILISNTLMSEGYCPSNNCESDWGQEQGLIGFVENGHMDEQKLSDFIDLNTNDYESAKILLGTRNDYIFYFEDETNTKITISGHSENVYGNPLVGSIEEIDAESFVRTTRLAYLENVDTKKIVKLIIIVW